MKSQRGFINSSDLHAMIVVFGVLCALGGVVFMWVAEWVWDFLRPIIHAWTG